MGVNLIGISGHIGSGKDLVGKIIQYLTSELYRIDNFTFKEWENYGKDNYQEENWQIVKFADKLKDIVCLLIGCTREQLEDREFKEKELGEEWWYYKGRNETLIPYTLNSKRSEEDLIKLTPRILLQQIGTDLFRKQLHPQYWVNATFADYKEEDDWTNTPPGEKPVKICPNWIITDTRFENEADAIRGKGGIIIRVNRPCETCGKYDNELCSNGYHTNNHQSEIALDDYSFDEIIENDGSIDELIEKVRKILIKYNII